MRKFFDTNVFLYAFLDQGDAKKEVAAKLIAEAVRAGDGWISTQVIREFFNVMLKKSARPMAEIKKAYSIFGCFKIVEDTLMLTYRGLEIKEKYGTQYFDSIILASAEKGLCELLYSKDFNDGQVYCGVKVVNPFRDRKAAE